MKYIDPKNPKEQPAPSLPPRQPRPSTQYAVYANNAADPTWRLLVTTWELPGAQLAKTMYVSELSSIYPGFTAVAAGPFKCGSGSDLPPTQFTNEALSPYIIPDNIKVEEASCPEESPSKAPAESTSSQTARTLCSTASETKSSIPV